MTAPRRRCILHIGTAKTGTTTIQALLAGSRGPLLAQGFAYPAGLGSRNHPHLALVVADDDQAARFARELGETGPVATIRDRIANRLAAEIEALPAAVHTIVFSSEALADIVAAPLGLLRLKALLDRWCDSYRILVYLRRQDAFAVSLYSTNLRNGGTETEILPGPDGDVRFDWAGLLDRWGAAFGQDALVPRVFDRAAFVDGDLLTDLRAILGIGPLPALGEAAPLNPALQPAAQEFLRRLNLAARASASGSPQPDAAAAGAIDAGPDKIRGAVRHLLDRMFAGPGRLPSRAAAEAFVARHAAGNARIRAAFFADRASLFSTDFSRYPLQAEPLPPGDAVAAVGVALALAQDEEMARLQAEVMVRRGRDRMADAPEEARRHFRRALGRRPGHVAALRGLLDLASTPELRGEVAERLQRAIAVTPDRDALRQLRQRLAAPDADMARAARRARRLAAQAPSTPPAPEVTPRRDAAIREARRAERRRLRGIAEP